MLIVRDTANRRREGGPSMGLQICSVGHSSSVFLYTSKLQNLSYIFSIIGEYLKINRRTLA